MQRQEPSQVASELRPKLIYYFHVITSPRVSC